MDFTLFSFKLELVMGPSQKFLTGVGSNFWCLGWVGSAIFGLGMDLENFP